MAARGAKSRHLRERGLHLARNKRAEIAGLGPGVNRRPKSGVIRRSVTF
jgi:hypothetical protein